MKRIQENNDIAFKRIEEDTKIKFKKIEEDTKIKFRRIEENTEINLRRIEEDIKNEEKIKIERMKEIIEYAIISKKMGEKLKKI